MRWSCLGFFPPVLGLLLAGTAWAEKPPEIIQAFSSRDNQGAWMKNRRYMRQIDDQTWKGRMVAMQKLVAAGKEAVPALLEALNSRDDSTRVFAAQTLGYLGRHVPGEPLLKAAAEDPNPAVRLYAVDALGMKGGQDLSEELAALKKRETNRDVLKHIGYAQERQATGIRQEVISTLVNWDSSTLDSAKVGMPAPDFQLQTVDGKKVRLSDFRGKQAVVLVFVYGDT